MLNTQYSRILNALYVKTHFFFPCLIKTTFQNK